MAYTRHPNLVLGFAAFTYRTPLGVKLYHHIAVYPDDRIYITVEAFPMSEPNFDTPTRTWEPLVGSTVQEVIDAPLTEDVHWLGHYPFLFNVPATATKE